MNISSMLAVGRQAAAPLILKTIKHSPTILVAAGVGSVVGSGVLMVRSTLKAQPIIDHTAADLDYLSGLGENPKDHDWRDVLPDAATANEIRFKIYRHAAWELTKIYAPAVTLGAVGITCILGGHKIMHQRNIAFAAALKAAEVSYAEYRKRVIGDIGEEKESAIWQDLSKETQINEATGKSQKVVVQGPNGLSQYSRLYDELNSCNFKRNRPDLNEVQIRAAQNVATAALDGRGYLFLNDVYKSLGMEPTPAGQVVGWIKRRGYTGGDGYVDFGLDDPNNESARRFLRGDSDSVWLDFNVDGMMFEQI